jgi:signal transduction histidine kinase
MSRSTEADDIWNEMNETLQRSQGMAVAGQFAVSIMHEINNPLEAVCNLNFLLGADPQNTERAREYSRLMEEQLKAITSIAQRTLNFYRSIDTVEETAIAAVADAALRVHQKKILMKRIALYKSLASDAMATVHAGELLQVLSNLIANAVDALPENGRLHLRIRRRREEVHITIADDGHGIPEAVHERIFDPFFTTKKERGTGLGLAISKAIVEKHKGRIRSRSSVRSGRSGTAFRIILPAGGGRKESEGVR